MEIQEINLNGVTYVPKRANPYDLACSSCALDDEKCSINILGIGDISPCSLFGADKVLKVKES